jgi:hypothetical protein
MNAELARRAFFESIDDAASRRDVAKTHDGVVNAAVVNKMRAYRALKDAEITAHRTAFAAKAATAQLTRLEAAAEMAATSRDLAADVLQKADALARSLKNEHLAYKVAYTTQEAKREETAAREAAIARDVALIAMADLEKKARRRREEAWSLAARLSRVEAAAEEAELEAKRADASEVEALRASAASVEENARRHRVLASQLAEEMREMERVNEAAIEEEKEQIRAMKAAAEAKKNRASIAPPPSTFANNIVGGLRRLGDRIMSGGERVEDDDDDGDGGGGAFGAAF